MYTVRVDEPDPRFGNMLLEQFGGANGELAAAMQYSIQGLNCEDPERKDLLMDIGTEELSHLEIVGTLARMHLKPMKFARDDFYNGHYENGLAARAKSISAACDAARTIMDIDDKIAERDGAKLGKTVTPLAHGG